MTLPFVSFPDIEGFHNVVKAINVYPHLTGSSPLVAYRGKMKQHGTNAGVRVHNGEIAAQSRTQTINVKNDNAGFARWVEDHKDFFSSLKLENATIFGEFCGPGIMKGTAINKLPHKVFAVFAMVLGDAETGDLIHQPDVLNNILADRSSDLHVLPWHGESFTVDFSSRGNLISVAEKLNKVVEEVEPCDPWVKSVFGIEGTAEGIVYYPYPEQSVIKRKQFGDLSFKAKGEKHKVVKTKESVQIDPEVAASVWDFINLFVTEPRLEQGVTATGVLEIKNVGNFLKWFSQDVLKESVDELAASNLTWEQVQKAVQNAARNWYVAKCKEIK